MINLTEATLLSLQSMNPSQIAELGEHMRYDSKKYASIIFPDLLAEKWTDEKRIAFLNGELYVHEIFPEHHLRMYQIYDDLIDGQLRNAAMILFREAAKTSLKRVIATKIISYAIFPVQLFVSETLEQAKKDTDAIKYYIETNPIIQYLFSNMKGGVWNKGEATFYSQGQELYILCKSMQSRMRGLNHKGHRVGITFGDDFESPENTATDISRQQIADRIENDIMHIGEGNFEHRLLLQGTIANPLAYMAKARYDLRFKEPYGVYYECAITKTDSVKFNYQTNRFDVAPAESFDIGQPIWPESKDSDYIQYQFDMARQGTGKSMWKIMQEWWNVPKQETKALFDSDKVTEYDGKFISRHGVTYIERMVDGKKKNILVDVYTGVDPASGRNDNTDDTTIVTLCRLPNGDFVLLDCTHFIEEFEKQLDACLLNLKKFTPRVMRIETIAYQHSLFSMVKSRARNGNLNSLIKDWDRKTGKNKKFKEGLTTLVNTGNLYYIKGCKGIERLKVELANFNRHEDKDDLIDGLYLAWYSAGSRLPKDVDVDKLIRTHMVIDDPIEKARMQIEAARNKNKHWTDAYANQ
jgi:hypothetical protein